MNNFIKPTWKRCFPGLDRSIWCVAALFPLLITCVGTPSCDGRENGRAKIVKAQWEINHLNAALRAHNIEYGFVPRGSNAQILSVLCGKNPKGIRFFDLEADGNVLSNGELLDPWGTPYRMGAWEHGQVWVYSAGRNAVDEGGAYGADDIVSWQR